MKQYFKRYLSLLLTFAMLFTMVPTSVVSAAGEGETVVGTTTNITCSKFVASGGQSQEGVWLIATNNNGTNGSATEAAYVAGETANKKEGGLGSARVGGMAFKLPTNADVTGASGTVDPDLISKAVVTVNVTDVNENMGTDKWTKAGLFSVDSSCYDTMKSDNKDNAASTYPAVGANGGDYGREATVFPAPTQCASSVLSP